MKADEIFEASAKAMKMIERQEDMQASLKRARARTEKEDMTTLVKERGSVNSLVQEILEAENPGSATKEPPEGLVDAVVMRHLRNRDVFMQTFPGGIEDLDPDPMAIWAATMVSPQDEA
jgi:hypothetical protein